MALELEAAAAREAEVHEDALVDVEEVGLEDEEGAAAVLGLDGVLEKRKSGHLINVEHTTWYGQLI